MTTTKLSAIYGGVAAGIHIGEVPPGHEAPYSAVPRSLCGIGNNNWLDIRWKKTQATEVTCATCFEKAQELYDEGAEVFDPSKPVSGWCNPPSPIGDFWAPMPMPTDGMIDLPTFERKDDDDN